MQLAVALDVGLELRPQFRFLLALGRKRLALLAQFVDGAHQVLRQIVRHATRIGARAVGLEPERRRRQAGQPHAQGLHVLLVKLRP